MRRIKKEILIRLEESYYGARFVARAKLQLMRMVMRNGGYKKRILFYPERPKHFHIVYPICHALGYKISNDPAARADCILRFDDTTTSYPDKTLVELAKKQKVINMDCSDISKVKVEEVFHDVFGYGMAINPRTHVGECVEKTDENALHSGKVIQCPAEPKDGYIYQKLIHTEKGNEAVDIRILICNETIPLIFFRYKDISDRFDNTTHAVRATADEALSKEEQRLVHMFCKKMGLEYGELDALRDNADGRLYIVDANKTPSGPWPGKHLSHQEYDIFFTTLRDAFESEFVAR